MSRKRLPGIALVFAGLALSGCPVEAPRPKAPEVKEAVKQAPPPPAPPPAYVIADLDAQRLGSTITLDDGAIGILVDNARLWTKAGELHVAPQLAPGQLNQVVRIPSWLGRGFLFRAGTTLYRSDTFGGELHALVALPTAISQISFGPQSALLRSQDGHRWGIEISSGKIAPILPIGLLDLATSSDGRSAAITEGGRISISMDKGAHWSDRTSQLGAVASSVVAIADEPWITDENNRAYKVEPGGALKEYDQLPSVPTAKLSARDPAWHGSEAPIVAAIRRGVRLDERNALVVQGGDVVRVDLRTGGIKVLSAGRLPPALPCEVLRAGDELLAVCATHREPSIVVTGLLSEKGPRIEKTFPSEGPFFASDDGSLAFGGACDGHRMTLSVCVRGNHGEWQEHGVEPIPGADAGLNAGTQATQDAGDPLPDPADLVRWVPRADGRPIGIIAGKVPGSFDPGTGAVHAFRHRADEIAFSGDFMRALSPQHGSRASILDRTWSATEGGVLRGWLSNGQSLTIRTWGDVERSAFTFPRVAVDGPLGFAFDRDGRAFQTLDRGATWAEVTAPPFSAKRSSLSPSRCSPVGCELGLLLRLGWDSSPPIAEVEAPPQRIQVPSIPRAPLPALRCIGAGDERETTLPNTPVSPEDFGFGARRLPVSGSLNDNEIIYQRRPVSRSLVDPPHGVSNMEIERPLFALIHGYHTSFEESSDPRAPLADIIVSGPQRDAMSFRRHIDFVEPFDTAGAARFASFTLRDLQHFTGATGLSFGRLFSSSGPEIDVICPVLPLDPAGPTSLVITCPSEAGQVVGTVTGGANPRVKFHGVRNTPEVNTVSSAVEIAANEFVALASSSDSSTDVFKISANGVSLIERLHFSRVSDYAPANPDALATGPQGALAILRTPSGMMPPSKEDPALLMPLGGGAPTVLAPWSTLMSADDAACRGDPSGFRAIIQTVAPWVQVRGAAPDLAGVMRARVRWGVNRVCLEAIEIPEGTRPTRGGDDLETTIVARFAAPASAGRVTFVLGTELRQPLRCTLTPP